MWMTIEVIVTMALGALILTACAAIFFAAYWIWRACQVKRKRNGFLTTTAYWMFTLGLLYWVGLNANKILGILEFNFL